MRWGVDRGNDDMSSLILEQSFILVYCLNLEQGPLFQVEIIGVCQAS